MTLKVFIVGAARSGTTRLKTAVGDAIGLPRTAEGHFYPILYDLDQALDQYFSRWYQIVGPNTMLKAVDRESLRAGMHGLVREIFDGVAGTTFVEKTPGSAAILALPMVVKQWPEAKIVFAKRRGIDSVLSALRKFPHWSFDFACRSWTDSMSAWSDLDGSVRSSSIEVDQLEMANDPEGVADRLAGYLGLAAAETVTLAQALTQKIHRQHQTTTDIQRVAIPLSCSPWTVQQREVFVDLCGAQMKAFGYSLE